jgi:predicted ATPase
MRITHLTLKNWRTFKNLEIDVGERLIIIGPNASGKSNLLDAVRFLRDLAIPGGGLQDAVRTRGGLSRVRCLFARNHNHGLVEISVALGDDVAPRQWTYSVSFRGEKGGHNRPVVARERVFREGHVVLDRPDDADEADAERLTQTSIEQISANKAFRDVAEFFAQTRYLHLVPQVIRDASRSGDRVDDPFGGDFIAHMNRVAPKTRNAWLRRVTKEEPELSLHPAVVRTLPSVLARAQRTTKAQVLLTTHSPELLLDEGVRPDEVLILKPTDDGTEGDIVSGIADAMELIDSGLSLVDIVLPRSEPPEIYALAEVSMGEG